MKLLFATQNKNKVKEVSYILGSHHDINTLTDYNFFEELPETHNTLEENALEKAIFVYKLFNVNSFAEDSGLEVEALNGKPGVLSARYAGEEKNAEANMDKVLDEMKNTANRKARFRTVIALIVDGKEFVFEGVVNGTILKEKRGKSGFGYDPIFQPEGFLKSFAEMSEPEKNTISHRAKAIEKMKNYLETILVQ